MRILAIDWGRKRIGFAVSDPLGITAQPLPTIQEESPQKVLQSILKTVVDLEVGEVVVGLPLRLDGTEGSAAKEVKVFADELSKKLSAPVQLVDERLTTALADTLLSASGQKGKKKREKFDTVAAQSILQTYLDVRRAEKEPNDGQA